MKSRQIGATGINGSVITLGTWGIGGGTSWGNVDDEASVKIIHQAFDLGINMIDSAPSYGAGHSEEVVGKAVKGRRSSFFIATKCGLQWRTTEGKKEYDRDGKSFYRNLTKESLRADLENSLKRLDTDYIDMYFTHRQPVDTTVQEAMEALLQFKKEGKIRAIGISNGNLDYLNEYMKYGQVDLVQEKYSILERMVEKQYIGACEAGKVTLQAFSVLERGMLTGTIGMDYELIKGEARSSIKWFDPRLRQYVVNMLEKWKPLCGKYDCSLSNLALAWVLSRSKSINVLFGVRKIENLVDSVKAVNINLSKEDAEKMKADADEVIKAAEVAK